jgi:DinB superfamily
MDGQEEHRARVAQLRESFAAANHRLLQRLRDAGDDGECAREDRWSPAQIGWHVAAVTTRFAGVISGELPGAQPVAQDFRERPWAEIVPTVAARLRAPAIVQPPTDVSCGQAIAELEAAEKRMLAALDGLGPERASSYGITSPIVGAINLYQVAEWATAHTIRHNRQAKLTLGR